MGPEKHYLLLVGPRGSGKTHFISILHHRLMDQLKNTGSQGAVLVAELNEEEWGVASFLDFVIRILRVLACQSSNLLTKLDTIYAKFSSDPDEAEAHAIAILRQHIQGRTLILFCENLVDLFGGLGDEGQKKLRSVIQEDGNWAMVASTPSLFAALTLQDNPFHGFFTIRQLEKIDFEAALEFLVKKAVHEDRPGLAVFLRTPLGRARMRAIHHLAAGNHRAYVVLFDFLEGESLDGLTTSFMQMVDDLTPYYQDRMRQLSPAQRKIVEFLCQQGVPTTIKDIAIPTLMSHQTTAKQVGELEMAGLVNRIRIGRNTFCELSEPLMRICIEVKDNRTHYFRLFVEFLRHWFTVIELEDRHVDIQHVETSRLDRVHIEEAHRCRYSDRVKSFRDVLDAEVSHVLEKDDFGGLVAIQEALVNSGGLADDYEFLIEALIDNGEFKRAITTGREAAAKFPDQGGIQHQLAVAHGSENQLDDALTAINHAIALEGERAGHLSLRADILLGLERYQEAIDDAQAALDLDPDHLHCFGQIIPALVMLDRSDEAEIRVNDLVEHAPANLQALFIASEFYQNHGRLEAVLRLLQTALELDPDNAEGLRRRGHVFFEMSEYRRASEDLRVCASLEPRSVWTHCLLANSLYQTGDWEEAAAVAEKLIHIDPDHVHAYLVYGSALIKMNRPEDAVVAFDNLLPMEDWESLLTAASAIHGVGDHASAKRYIGRVAELKPDRRDLWITLKGIHTWEESFDAATENAGRLEMLPMCSPLGRLLAARVAAATMPFYLALDALDALGAELQTGDFSCDDQVFSEADAEALTVSPRSLGHRILSEGLQRLRRQLEGAPDVGLRGKILTNFLHQTISHGLAGFLLEWEEFDSMLASLEDVPDCRIPLHMLRAVFGYSTTGDERHLLSLPLEQRQLLEGRLAKI